MALPNLRQTVEHAQRIGTATSGAITVAVLQTTRFSALKSGVRIFGLCDHSPPNRVWDVARNRCALRQRWLKLPNIHNVSVRKR